ncbi:hypothetical protein NQK81_21215 [Amycolatopsis roodepoortensis]|uniref:hypothetical protein n=1 Tax=Amycolatopsis roodepoortensis TaxID=700274 RepID=UPI00214C83EF|nr:hypothetical protein [Amycolatopsis roodepoortensis]UUV35854.1 hypothetical protein NQK81_21215 [Amycolatopsis roodepoortensis]
MRTVIVLMATAFLVYLVMPDSPLAIADTQVTAHQFVPSPLAAVPVSASHDGTGQAGLTSDEVTVLGRATVLPQPSDPGRDHAAAGCVISSSSDAVPTRRSGSLLIASLGGQRSTLSFVQVRRC